MSKHNCKDGNNMITRYFKKSSRKDNKMKLYRLTTTWAGANGPSRYYFDTPEKALAYMAKCENGEIEKVSIAADYPINYSDGCTEGDLTCGEFDAKIEVIK